MYHIGPNDAEGRLGEIGEAVYVKDVDEQIACEAPTKQYENA